MSPSWNFAFNWVVVITIIWGYWSYVNLSYWIQINFWWQKALFCVICVQISIVGLFTTFVAVASTWMFLLKEWLSSTPKGVIRFTSIFISIHDDNSLYYYYHYYKYYLLHLYHKIIWVNQVIKWRFQSKYRHNIKIDWSIRIRYIKKNFFSLVL